MRDTDFEPIFIVGNPRSGTTLLATLLSRHSKIAIPSETQFFRKVLRCGIVPVFLKSSHEKLCEKQFSYFRTADLNIDRDEFLSYFKKYRPTYPNLFRAVLEFYALKEDKTRAGEKSPVHLFYVPHIIKWFPKAKIIFIVRDGRDAVLSLMKVPWGHNNIKRHCAEWNYYARLIKIYRMKYFNSTCIVKYEDLISKPEETLRQLLSFVGEVFESKLLDPNSDSGVVAKWEGDWKSKATKNIDSSRLGAWRAAATLDEGILMNKIMGRYLGEYGYEVDQNNDNSFATKFIGFLKLSPYLGFAYFIVRGIREFIKKLACFLRLREIENELPKSN